MSDVYDYNKKPLDSAYRSSPGLSPPDARKGAGRLSTVPTAMGLFGLLLIAALVAIVLMLRRGLFSLF